jgi:hypothetical protein
MLVYLRRDGLAASTALSIGWPQARSQHDEEGKKRERAQSGSGALEEAEEETAIASTPRRIPEPGTT